MELFPPCAMMMVMPMVMPMVMLMVMLMMLYLMAHMHIIICYVIHVIVVHLIHVIVINPGSVCVWDLTCKKIGHQRFAASMLEN